MEIFISPSCTYHLHNCYRFLYVKHPFPPQTVMQNTKNTSYAHAEHKIRQCYADWEEKKKIFYAFRIDSSMKKSWRLLTPNVTFKQAKRDFYTI